jgi:hypothetical protein
VSVENDVFLVVHPAWELLPGLGTYKAIGEHDGDCAGLFAHNIEGVAIEFVEVFHRVVGLAELVQRWERLVDERQGELVTVGLLEDEVCGEADELERLRHVRRVVPPVDLVGFALIIKTTLTAGKAVKVYDDMHAFGDRVLGNLGEVMKLLAGIVIVALDGGHKRPVTDRNSDKIDPVACKNVDVVGCDELLVALLKKLAARLRAEDLAETVFIDGGRSTVTVKESRVDAFLLAEPASEVDTIGFERVPSYEGSGFKVGLLGGLFRNRFDLLCECFQNTDESTRCLATDLEDVVRPLEQVGGCLWRRESACQRNGAEDDGGDLHDNECVVSERG